MSERPGSVFRHIGDDEGPWREVKRQRNADGTTSSVWERWLAFREPRPVTGCRP